MQNTYQAMSRYGRLNLEKSRNSRPIPNVEKLISEIKHLNDRPLKKMALKSSTSISRRLLPGQNQSSKIRARSYLQNKPHPKPKKKKPIPPLDKPYPNEEELPGVGQYTPNFNVYLEQPPSIGFSHEKQEQILDSNQKTQSELIRGWETNLRAIAFIPENKMNSVSISQNLQNTTLKSDSKFSNQDQDKSSIPGIISTTHRTELFNVDPDNPAPGQYQINRQSIGQATNSTFSSQSSRKDLPTIPDRPHFNIAQGIDYIKPSAPHCIPFSKQLPREKQTKQKSDVWDEIEKEQEQLKNLLHPPEYIPETHKTRVQPFSLQTSHFDKHPFHQFMGNEESKDLLYDVDSNLQAQNKKIPPRSNFGRRLNDNNRSLVQKTEAPDKIYGDMNNNWKKVQKSSGTGPLFDNSPPRKSAYDYMPMPEGGSYQYINSGNWNSKTSVMMNNMGDRELMIEIPPQYAPKPASLSMQAHNSH